jgi:membrane protease YdiL (CAAX protease family)
MLSRMASPVRDAPPIGTAAALLLLPITFALLALVGAAALDWGLPGVAVAQLVGFALPAWLTAARSGRPARVLALVRPSRRALAGAALVGATYWYLSAALLVPLVDGLMTEREVRELTLHFSGPEPLAVKLLALAALPAVCEELLFRGAIARGLRGRLGLAGAALLSSAYFALMHGSLARLPITFALGLILAIATLRTGSLWPAMMIHAGNNSAAVALSWPPLAGLEQLLGDHVGLMLPLAALATGVGLNLLWRGGNGEIPLVSDATSL